MTVSGKNSQRKSLLYSFVIFLASIVFHTILPIRYHHLERTKLEAPYILVGNHISMLDPVIIGYGCKPKQVRYLGKAELTQNPFLRFFFKNILMVPVSRYNTDMKALRICLKVLSDGHVLGIFPEGTRSRQGKMEELEGGIAMIALQSDVPILPAYIHGKVKPFHRVHCTYGEPFTVSDIKSKGVNKETAEQVLERIRSIYRNLALESAQTQ